MAEIFKKRLTWAILLSVFLLYSFKLGYVPVHLNQDELGFSLNAYSISKTLQDTSGHFLPFYFWHLGSFWATPVITYICAIILKFLPLSEWTIRLTSVFTTTLSIVGVMSLSKLLFKRDKFAWVSGILMAATPVLFINSRVLLDNITPIPFVIYWLLLLKVYSDKKELKYLFISTLILGFGIHSYHAAKVMMPIYFLVTNITLFKEIKGDKKILLVSFAGFLIPIVIFVPWLIIHPDTLLNQVSYIGALDKSVNVSKGLLGVFNINRLSIFINSYITYLGPKILFIEGDRSLIHSTGRVGAFLFPTFLLLVFGILQIWYRQKERISKIILFGLLTYPIAPSIVNDPHRISRGLVVVPFAVLIFIYGIVFIENSKEKLLKILFIAIILLSTLQFINFLNDYFGNYRIRSESWFNYDIGGTFESALKSTEIRNVGAVYIDRNIYFAETYYDFYLLKFKKQNVKEITHFFDAKTIDFTKFSPGSLVILAPSDVSGRSDRYGLFEKIETIREPDGRESFYIFYRDK